MLSAQVKQSLPDDAIGMLNAVLKCTLTGINQYFLHARMLKHKGFMRLADYEYKESLDTMKYTDQLVNLILTLGGAPNLQELGKLRIGEAVPQMLANDLALAEETKAVLEQALALNEHAADMLQAMIKSETEHAAFIQREMSRIDSLGLNAYLKNQL